jgi:hypothetical protein
MISQRWRPVCISVLAVVAVWATAMIGYKIAKNSRVTAEKVKVFADSVDLASLSAEARAKAIQRLAEMINALSVEERRRTRLEQASWKWLEQMTEDEKSTFVEATVPTGFKQMLNAFEQLPEDKRRKAVDDAVRHLRDEQKRLIAENGEGTPGGTNLPPPISPELQARIRTMGLRAFYSQSSAQTKAELAPVLEELQRIMESGRPFHGR